MTRIALLLSSLLMSGCLIGPDEAQCSAGTCGGCIELAGCGWCPGRGCVPATSFGPDRADLFCQNDFRWDECTPREDPCIVHVTRDRCVLAGACEWCAGGGGCSLYGNACAPVAPPPPIGGCTNTCSTSSDGECDDGGIGSSYSICELGTDCDDCGYR